MAVLTHMQVATIEKGDPVEAGRPLGGHAPARPGPPRLWMGRALSVHVVLLVSDVQTAQTVPHWWLQ
eukprot:14403646-Alexandrium_andersonii.AAC.1